MEQRPRAPFQADMNAHEEPRLGRASPRPRPQVHRGRSRSPRPWDQNPAPSSQSCCWRGRASEPDSAPPEDKHTFTRCGTGTSSAPGSGTTAVSARREVHSPDREAVGQAFTENKAGPGRERGVLWQTGGAHRRILRTRVERGRPREIL